MMEETLRADRWKISASAVEKIKAAGYALEAPEVHCMPKDGGTYEQAHGYLRSRYPKADLGSSADLRFINS
jgi:hypothetical protein